MDSYAEKRERALLQCQWGGLIDTLFEQYGESVAVEELVKIEPTLVERLRALEGCRSLYEVIKVFQKYDWPSIEPNADSWMNRINSPLLDQLNCAFKFAAQAIEYSEVTFRSRYGIDQQLPFHVRQVMYLRMMEHVISNEALNAFDFILEHGVDLSEFNYAYMFGHSQPKILPRMLPLTKRDALGIVSKTSSEEVLDIIVKSEIVSLDEMLESIESRPNLILYPKVVIWAVLHGSTRSLRLSTYYLNDELALLKSLKSIGSNVEQVEQFGVRIANRAVIHELRTVLEQLLELQIPFSLVTQPPRDLNMYTMLRTHGFRANSDVYKAAFASRDMNYVKKLFEDQVPVPADVFQLAAGTELSNVRFKSDLLRFLVQQGCTIRLQDYVQFRALRPGYAKLISVAVR